MYLDIHVPKLQTERASSASKTRSRRVPPSPWPSVWHDLQLLEEVFAAGDICKQIRNGRLGPLALAHNARSSDAQSAAFRKLIGPLWLR